METIIKVSVATAIFTVCFTAIVLVSKYKTEAEKRRKVFRSFGLMNVLIVTNETACNDAVTILRRKCTLKNHNAIGFDCILSNSYTEQYDAYGFNTHNRQRRPVALLQLSILYDICCVFRLNEMKTVPSSLKALLEDNSIYKVGVPFNNAEYPAYLLKNYGVEVKSYLDLRYLASVCSYNSRRLASLHKELFDFTLVDESWEVRARDWEAEQLADRQVYYAAANAHAAIKIFTKLIMIYTYENSAPSTDDFCRYVADTAFNKRKIGNLVIIKNNHFVANGDLFTLASMIAQSSKVQNKSGINFTNCSDTKDA